MKLTNIPMYSIVKIRKQCYNMAHTDYRCDLLVIVSHTSDEFIIVKYPDGHSERVLKEDVLLPSSCFPDHPGYNKRVLNMPAFLKVCEFNKRLLERLAVTNPVLHAEVTARLSVKEPKQEQELEPEPPTINTQPELIAYIKGIDEKLGLILNLLREVVQCS